MSDSKKGRPLTIFALLTILFWLSFLLFLPPFYATHDIKSLISEAHEAKEFNPEMDKPGEVLEVQFIHSFRLAFVQSLLIIIGGVVSGILLLARRRFGQILAIVISAGMLILRVIDIGESLHIWKRIYFIFVMWLPKRPFYVVHNDIIAVLFYIGTIFYLTRKSISQQIRKA